MSLESECISALNSASMAPGTWDKRFRRNLPAEDALTDKQRYWLIKLTHKYRRQIPNALLIQRCAEWIASHPEP